MNVEVLVSTMNQKGFALVETMNLKTDAIIINQSNKMSYNRLIHDGNEIKLFDFNERGIGLSRNNALMRSNADICLFADDDVVYYDDYNSKVINAFKEEPKADIIVFNVPSKNSNRATKLIRKKHRVRTFNCLKYGAVRIAIRRKSIIKNSHYFSILFGASRYGSGEDSIFIYNAIKKGMKVYASPKILGEVEQNDSSWFVGFNSKYFIDKGALFACLSNRCAKILSIQFIIRHYNKFPKDMNLKEIYKLMLKGIRQFRNNDY